MPLPLDITYITIFVHEFLFISQCCGPARPFDMNITDNTGMEVVITSIHHTIIIFIVPDSPYMSIICLPPPPVQRVHMVDISQNLNCSEGDSLEPASSLPGLLLPLLPPRA